MFQSLSNGVVRPKTNLSDSNSDANLGTISICCPLKTKIKRI